MLGSRLRRTIREKNAAQRFAAPATPMPIQMAVVTEVEPGDGTPGSAYATVETESGSTIPLYPVGGYLPAVGDQVPTVMNGDDPIGFATRVMVDGDMQSRTWTGIDGPPGWLFTADGNLYAINGYFKGELVAQTFSTPPHPVTGAHLLIDFVGSSRIDLVNVQPITDEEVSARFAGSVDRVGIESSTPVPLGAPLASVTAGRDVVSGDGTHGFVEIQATDGPITMAADDITANGISITDPPTFHAGRTTTQSPGLNVWEDLTHTTVHHASGFTVVSSNRYRADEPGRYRAKATVEWTGGTYWAGTRISKNGAGIGSGVIPSDFDFRGVGHDIDNGILGASQTATECFELDGVSDYLQVAVFSSAAGENATMVDVLIERIGPL